MVFYQWYVYILLFYAPQSMAYIILRIALFHIYLTVVAAAAGDRIKISGNWKNNMLYSNQA